MVAISSSGEICDLVQSDQFQIGKTQFACGYYAVGMALSMNEVGKPPVLTSQQVIADAEAWYALYNGNNLASNTLGMSLQQLYDLLALVKLHYQNTNNDINVIKKWLAVGYPVMVAIAEASVFDFGVNGPPYPWTPTGNHIILITGVDVNGNVLVRDSANCTNLNDPTSLRPGPRVYDAHRLALVSATVIVPPWMPRPASSTPPVAVPVQPPHIASLWGSQWQEQAALQEWNSSAMMFAGEHSPSYTTGIALAWQERYRKGLFDGPPIKGEEASHDWAGNPIIVQQFARRRYEWRNGQAKQY